MKKLIKKRNLCRMLADVLEAIGMSFIMFFCVAKGAGVTLNVNYLIIDLYVILMGSFFRRAYSYYNEKILDWKYEKQLEKEKEKFYSNERAERTAYKKHFSTVTSLR